MSASATAMCSFTVFTKGEKMWIRRVLQNKSAVSKISCYISQL